MRTFWAHDKHIMSTFWWAHEQRSIWSHAQFFFSSFAAELCTFLFRNYHFCICVRTYSIWNNHWHLCKGIINKWSCYLFKGSFLTNIWCNCKGTCIIALFSLYRGFDLHCAVSLRHYVVDMLLWSCEENKSNFQRRRGLQLQPPALKVT